MALTGRVIASHYAEPLLRTIARPATAYSEPSLDSAALAQLAPGDQLRMLDLSRGWGWGYLPNGRVAYVEASALIG